MPDWSHFAAQIRERLGGILDESQLQPVGYDFFLGRKYAFYECPCGISEPRHHASRPFIADGLSQSLGQFLSCAETRQQWYVRPPDVTAMILDEERRYLDLLQRAEKLVPKIVSKRGRCEETYAFLKDTHGIDREIADDILDAA